MTRQDTLRVFLGLIDAAEVGVVTDVLWMGTGMETMWEFFMQELGLPEEAMELNLAELKDMIKLELSKPGGSR